MIHPQKPVGNEKIKLTLVKGAAKFWKEKTKEVEVTATEFTPDNKGLTLWVEATDVSKSIRDIEIKVEYNGMGNVVKATAVWAKVTAVAHDTKTSADLLNEDAWKDLTTPPKADLTLYGGTGLRPINAVNKVKNIILIQYTVLPAGVAREPDEKNPIVKFDITRQSSGKVWLKVKDVFEEQKFATQPPFSEQRVEKPNDDNDDTDESAAPTAKDFFYVIDAPGLKVNEAFANESVIYNNFREFVRVRVDGKRPTSNDEVGSRASDYYNWHVRHWLLDQGGVWVRSTGDAKETKQNDIEPDPIQIGNMP